MEYKPTSEERIWAALSHASAILFGMGLVIPIIAWVDQRKKSQYVSYHALQALGYQTIGYTVWFLVYLLLIVLGFILWIPISISMNNSAGNTFSLLGIVGAVVMIVLVFGSILIYALLPLIAAIAIALGKDFRYPILGRRLAQFLAYDPAASQAASFIEKNEESWIASTGHFSVIIPFWGILLPMVVFFTQKNRSIFLKFQTAQTILYQLIGLLGYLTGFCLYLVSILSLIPISLMTVGSNGNESFITLGFVFFIFLLCCAGSVILIIPLYHILGQWAGLRVLKGDNYHYPIIGSLAEKILKKFFGDLSSKTSAVN